MPIFLETVMIDIPTVFPSEQAGAVQLFSFAKIEICEDARVGEALRAWAELDELEGWIGRGMPDEGVGRHVIPTSEEISRYRTNTLGAIYHNPTLRGLYASCRDQADARRLGESIDKIATMLAVTPGARGDDGGQYRLRETRKGLGLYNGEGQTPSSGQASDGVRSLITVATHFAKAAQFFDATNANFHRDDFRRHMLATLSRIFSLSTIPQISETQIPASYEQFVAEIFTPLYRKASSADMKRTERGLTRYLEMIAMASPGAVPETDLIRDVVPRI